MRLQPAAERQHLMWALVIVVVVSISLLYCAGLAGTLARSLLLTTPSPTQILDVEPAATEMGPDASPEPSLVPTHAVTATATLLP
jgi:hypothetical protein